MDFKELSYILAITEERSFSRAALRLFISQPSLSQYVKRLENSLGFELFKRSIIPLTLTNEGEQYVEYAKRILVLREEMQRGIEDIANSRRGKVVVGMSMARGSAILPLFIPFFKKRHPDIEIALYEKPAGESINLEKLLSESKIDLCVLSPPIIRKDIVCETLYNERVLLAAPPGHHVEPYIVAASAEGLSTIDLTHLKDEPFILSMEHTQLRVEAEKICAESGFKPKILLETNSLETAQKMVSVNYGFTFVPEMCVRDMNEKHCPSYYTFHQPNYTWPLYIAYKKDGYISKASRAFLEALREYFDKHVVRLVPSSPQT